MSLQLSSGSSRSDEAPHLASGFQLRLSVRLIYWSAEPGELLSAGTGASIICPAPSDCDQTVETLKWESATLLTVEITIFPKRQWYLTDVLTLECGLLKELQEAWWQYLSMMNKPIDVCRWGTRLWSNCARCTFKQINTRVFLFIFILNIPLITLETLWVSSIWRSVCTPRRNGNTTRYQSGT